MFSEIRNRLTAQYAAVMAVFLLAFIVSTYSAVLWVLYREEQRAIKAFLDEETKEHVMTLKNSEGTNLTGSNDNSIAEAKLFSYVYDRTGRLIAAEFPPAQMRSAVEAAMRDWRAPAGVGKIRRHRLSSGEMAIYIMASTQVVEADTVVGTVYVGEDITSYYEVLKLTLVILAVGAIIFLFGAAYLGHLLAGKAIVPVRQSFFRQREFVADASHELRTPLTVLLTSVDVVQRDDANRLTPFSTATLDDMKSEIRRMTKIVADLLTLARADAGAVNIVKEQVDLAAIAGQIVRSLQPLADDKGVKLELANPGKLSIFADRERISQLLLILIDNALKYTPSGGAVKVALGTAQGKKQGVTISVADTGIGIESEYQDLAFERFYRVDKARSREEGGSGLGLSIAKWIVQAHGGTIRVESIAGKGSTFIATFPNQLS